MKPRISIITLGVRDLERSRRFYKEDLGLPQRDESTEGVAFFQNARHHACPVAPSSAAKDAAITTTAQAFPASRWRTTWSRSTPWTRCWRKQ